MEDAGVLTFQARMDQKLMKASLRRVLLPFVAAVAAAALVTAALLYRAGDPGGWAVPVLGGGALGIAFLVFMVPEQVAMREAHKFAGPGAYRIDAEGVHTAHGFSTNTLPWSAIKAVHRARGQILLTHHGRSDRKRRMSIIPTGDLSALERARLLAVLRSRGTALTHAPTV